MRLNFRRCCTTSRCHAGVRSIISTPSPKPNTSAPARARAGSGADGSCTVAARVSEGKPARAILRVADEEQADLIVLGVQGRGAVELMVFGSNAHAVIREARCPVLVVPAPRGT